VSDLRRLGERRLQLVDAGEMATRGAAEVVAELRQRRRG